MVDDGIRVSIRDEIKVKGCQSMRSNYLYYKEFRMNMDDISIEISALPDGVKWGITFLNAEDDISSVSTLTETQQTWSADKFRKVRHELIAEVIGIQTDVRLGQIFGDYDNLDILTPDFCFYIDEDILYVLELTTTISEDYQDHTRTCDMKSFKYLEPLQVRGRHFNKTCFLGVLLISPTVIRSPFPLSVEMVNDIFVRMSVGRYIELNYPALTTESHSGTHYEKGMQTTKIKAMLESIEPASNIPTRHPLHMGEEFIKQANSPPNYTYVRDYMAESLKKAAQTTIKDPSTEPLRAFLRVMDNQSSNSHRTDSKSVALLPLVQVTPLKGPATSDVDFVPIPGCTGHYLAEIWDSAMQHRLASQGFEEESVEKLLEKAMEPVTDKRDTIISETRKKYRRVNCLSDVSETCKILLARKGICGKRYEDHPVVVEAEEKRKKPFKWDVETDDISDFIRRPRSQWLEDIGPSQNHELVYGLLRSADEIHGNADPSLIHSLMSTRMFHALDLISQVAEELAVSLRQNVNRDEMILKKLRHYPVYLLIKPTSLNSHIFCSLMIKVSDIGFYDETVPFGKLHRFNEVAISDFVSFRASKLQNQIQLPMLWVGSLIRWHMELGGDPSVDCAKGIMMESIMQSQLSVLIAAEDKAKTEESVTLLRYMLMEILKGTTLGRNSIPLNKPDPFKIISKFNTIQRSRLEIFIQKCNIDWCLAMTKDPPVHLAGTPSSMVGVQETSAKFKSGIEMLEDASESAPSITQTRGWGHKRSENDDELMPTDLCRDNWSGLFNPYTLCQMSKASNMIQLIYVGYYKNKDESIEGNRGFHLVEKIVEEEMKYDPARLDYYGGKDPPIGDLRPHEFSPSIIKVGVDLLCDKLKSELGNDYKEVLSHEILGSLSGITIDSLATLKASADLDPTKQTVDEVATKVEREARIKVVEALAMNAEDLGCNPIDNLPTYIDKLEKTWEGVACDIFQKNQHGGMREIYVMILHSRLVQVVVETVSKTILRHFPEDTLANPHMKLRNIDNHNVKSARAARQSDSPLLNFNNSDDEKRWNQNIMVTSFGLIFARLLPEWLSSPLIRILNLWIGKKVRLPDSVIKLLMSGTHLSSEAYEHLLDMFWEEEGEELSRILGKRGKYLLLMTGMWQGILHFTSSLLHLCQILHYKSFSDAFLTMRLKNIGHLLSGFCSSDDSGVMLSMWRKPDCSEENTKEALFYVHMILSLKRFQSQAFNMISSEKSTVGLPGIIEYNSIFIIYGTVVTPTIKFWVPAMQVKHTENLKSRQEESYNMLSELAQNRAGAIECRYMNYCSGIMHYKCLGLDLNPLFPSFAESVILTQDPEHGFFLTDDELAPGLLGFKYSCWRAARDGRYGPSLASLVSKGAIQVDNSGSMSGGAILSFGGRSRWKNLLKVVVGDLDVEGELLKDPSIPFRRPMNLDEVKTHLALIATSPGVFESLSHGNNMINSISSTVYSLQDQCFTKTTVGLTDVNKTERVIEKTSLLRLISDSRSSAFLDHKPYVPLLFPAFSNYEKFRTILDGYKRSQTMLIKGRHPRIRMNPLNFSVGVASQVLDLQKVIRSMWFDMDVKASSSLVRRCFEAYCKQIPWLKDTFEETFKASPFADPTSLIRFVKTQSDKTRCMNLLCRPIRAKGVLETFDDVIRFNQHPDRILMMKSRGLKGHMLEDHEDKLNRLSGQLALLSLLPMDSSQRQSMLVDTLLSVQASDSYDYLSLSRRARALSICQWVAELMTKPPPVEREDAEDDSFSEEHPEDYRSRFDDVIKAIRGEVEGLVVYFTKIQKFDHETETFKGRGIVRVENDKLCAEAHLKDDKVEEIRTNSIYLFRTIGPRFVELITEWLSSVLEEIPWMFRGGPALQSDGSVSINAVSGTPIIEDQGLSPTSLTEGLINLKVIMVGRRIKVVMHHPSGGPSSTLYSMRLNPRHIRTPTTTRVSEDLHFAWINGYRWCWENALQLLRGLMRRSQDPGIDHNKIDKLDLDPQIVPQLIHWVKSSFKSRLLLRQSGTPFGALSDFAVSAIQETVEVNVDEVSEFILSMIDDDDMELPNITNLHSNLKTIVEEEGDEVLGLLYGADFEEIWDDTGAFSETFTLRDEATYYISQFWDDVIAKIPDMGGKRDYWQLVLSKTNPKMHTNTDELFAWVLDIKYKDVDDASHIFDRFFK